jgi:hypothetical protein
MAANTARTSSARAYSLAQRTTVSMVAPGLLAAAYSSGASRFLASVSQNSAVWMEWDTEAAWVSQ